jgi:hypothetical protein
VANLSDKNEMAPESGNVAPAKLSRRAMLRGTAAAMPIALTLQSGAALARSSNLISGAADAAEDADGNKYCLDASSVISGDSPHHYDMGEPSSAEVTVLPKRVYYLDVTAGSDPVVGRPYICSQGVGPFYYKDGGKQHFKLNQGSMVSLTVMSSLSGSILVKDVDFL